MADAVATYMASVGKIDRDYGSKRNRHAR